MDKNGHFGELVFSATLKHFRRSDGANYNGGKAIIDFQPHFFKVRFEGSKNTFAKLYHESFKESELISTFEEMGNWIFKGLEEQIERDKPR